MSRRPRCSCSDRPRRPAAARHVGEAEPARRGVSTTSRGPVSAGRRRRMKYARFSTIVRDARDLPSSVYASEWPRGRRSARIRSGRCGAQSRRGERLRGVLRASHRTFDRRGRARQRRQHGQSGNARRAPGIARTCFSVEPGIYLSNFGIRSEFNVYVSETDARVTGEIQRELIRVI